MHAANPGLQGAPLANSTKPLRLKVALFRANSQASGRDRVLFPIPNFLAANNPQFKQINLAVAASGPCGRYAQR
jgi:hypothetical protein